MWLLLLPLWPLLLMLLPLLAAHPGLIRVCRVTLVLPEEV
jgi:hypothetical protein